MQHDLSALCSRGVVGHPLGVVEGVWIGAVDHVGQPLDRVDGLRYQLHGLAQRNQDHRHRERHHHQPPGVVDAQQGSAEADDEERAELESGDPVAVQPKPDWVLAKVEADHGAHQRPGVDQRSPACSAAAPQRETEAAQERADAATAIAQGVARSSTAAK